MCQVWFHAFSVKSDQGSPRRPKGIALTSNSPSRIPCHHAVLKTPYITFSSISPNSHNISFSPAYLPFLPRFLPPPFFFRPILPSPLHPILYLLPLRSVPASFLAGKRESRCHSTTGLARMVSSSYQMKQVLTFCYMGEGFTSFSINNRTNFFGEKKVKWSVPGRQLLFENTRKNLILILPQIYLKLSIIVKLNPTDFLTPQKLTKTLGLSLQAWKS